MARGSKRTKKPYLVIGIDFGTTYTGLSYSWSAAYEDDTDIIAITDWPAVGLQIEHAAKAPTQIAYDADETGSSTNCWGYLIKPGVKRCVWMKLILDKNARVTDHDDPDLRKAIQVKEQQFPVGKSVHEVTVDFFRELYQFTMQSLSNDYPDMLIDITPIKYWFTMPAIWSDEAQIKTLLAAEKGGFGARRGDEVSVITEPEAAALATLTNSWPSFGDEIRTREKGVLVCDCGGGTVDLTAYRVVKDDPWQLEECVIGDGGKCGATNLDRNLGQLLSGRFKEKFDNLDPVLTGPGSQMMQDFEWNKRIFGKPGATLKQLRLFMDEKDSPHYDALDGAVILTDADMKGIFDPVVARIITLIARQVKAAYDGDGPEITYVLLVGGLGDSPYLRSRLGEWCASHGIRMGGPQHSWGAVVKGAVVRGLELATVIQKKCRRHYDHMEWSIKRGSTIKPEDYEPLQFYGLLTDTDQRLELDLKSCSLAEAPEWLDGKVVEDAGTVIADLRDIDFSRFQQKQIEGVTTYKVDYSVEVVLGHKQGTVGFRVKIGEQVVGQTSVVFEEEGQKKTA